MATLVLDPKVPEIEALKERRRRSGIDRLDEVWEGVLHMVPAPHGRHAEIGQQLAELLGPAARDAGLKAMMQEFNLGEGGDDYRVPDGALMRPGKPQLFYKTAALVVEIVAPGDESWQKLPFFAKRAVDEVLIVDPEKREVHWLALSDGEYREIERSDLIALGPAELHELIDWP